MHPHCWLLVDRFLGHGIVKQNLPAFVQAIKQFWRDKKALWRSDPFHGTSQYPCYDTAAPWIKEHSPVPRPYIYKTTHIPMSPLIIRDIQKLIAMATQEHQNSLGYAVRLRSIVYIPIEIKMMIIDTIHQTRPPCYEKIQDIRSVLEAFQWKLPDSYWQRLCNPRLVFEVQDLIDSGTQVDWAYFCLGLHELLSQKDWYCERGLYFRGRILNLIESIRGSFPNTT